jgi:hypothetical protein
MPLTTRMAGALVANPWEEKRITVKIPDSAAGGSWRPAQRRNGEEGHRERGRDAGDHYAVAI